ncbi:MAG: MFS transporter [Blastocatellia bacterium]|nr:MFS transporter [Blastocatellia bacterium]
MESQTTDPDSSASRQDAYAALRVRAFRRFFSGGLLSVLGMQMQTVAVSWLLYEKTGSAWSLANVGLVQVAPMLGLALLAGQAADRFDRRKLLMGSTVLAILSALGLATVSWFEGSPAFVYTCLFLSGTARAFQGPARSALLPQLVPREAFGNSVKWSISGFELSSMIGPALGGFLIDWSRGATAVFLLAAFGSLFYFLMLSTLEKRAYIAEQTAPEKATTGLQNLVAGFKYVRHNNVLLAAMTLDLFAVLLGGAVAMLPIYAKDILHVGPRGMGWMQAAPSLCAVTMALLTTHLPPFRKAGRTLLWAVAGFGVATIIFGLSRNFWLSMAMLFLTGAFDNISVVIRHTLSTMLTPDEMRGRVSAINGMFISASNELGRFESGSVAALFTPLISVVSGGIGTILVVGAVALGSPRLRQYGSLDGKD